MNRHHLWQQLLTDPVCWLDNSPEDVSHSHWITVESSGHNYQWTVIHPTMVEVKVASTNITILLE